MRLIRSILAVYYREMLILRRKLPKTMLAMSVSPLLYLVAFGYGLGGGVVHDGHTYMEFLLPGLVAMNSMTQAWSISSEINIARFYWHIFEEIQSSPVSDMAYVTGEVLAGMTRAVLGAGVIVVLGHVFGVALHVDAFLVAALLLNSFAFASLAVALAMLISSHADQSMVTSFVITPMAFLSGTFFPVDRLPAWGKSLVSLLPLTHATTAIRDAAFGNAPNPSSYLILLAVGALFYGIALRCVARAKD